MKRSALWLAAALLALSASVPAAAHPYNDLVVRIGAALNVPPSLIHAVVYAESKYDATATSPSGAIGLMQLIPRFGAREAYRWLYGEDRIPTDQALKRPDVSLWLGTAYLRILDDRYFSWIDDTTLRLHAVIAAYNWGPVAVLDTLFPTRRPITVAQFMAELDTQAPRETRAYVRRVLATLKKNRAMEPRYAFIPQ